MKKITAKNLLILIFILLSTMSAGADSSVLPLRQIKNCIHRPFRGTLEEISVFGKVDVKKGTLYQVSLRMKDGTIISNSPQILLFSKNKCSVVYSDSIGDAPPLHRYFGTELSRILALNWYSWLIKREGRESFQHWLDQPNLSMPSESHWALKQLGFRVPDKYNEVK